MVIVDEAHNSRTELSFRTLARFNPSLILELTATPQTEHKPERDKHASNILYSVSAAELKAEQMICQMMMVAAINTQGAQASCCFLFMTRSWVYWLMAADAPVLRMAPMWPRSSCTMSVNSGV